MRTLDSVRAVALSTIVVACAAPVAPGASQTAVPTSSPSSSVSPTSLASPSAPAPPQPSQPAIATDPPEETLSPGGPGWAQDPPKPLLTGAAVKVIVDRLNVREMPSTSARTVGTLSSDAVLVVGAFPPVSADGYIWYHGTESIARNGELPPLPQDPRARTDQLTGWFAALKGSAHYVEPLQARCPAAVDLRNLGAMLSAERLACFGNDSIKFEGTYGCAGCMAEIFGDFRPDWLANPNLVNLVSVVGTNPEELGMNLRLPPAISKHPADGSIVRVLGHFDDPKSADCSVAMDPPWGDILPVPAPSSYARLVCRQQFVVEKFEFLGIDPAFT